MSEPIVLGEPLVKSVSVVSFRLRVLSLDLGKSVRFAIHLECESGGKPTSEYKELVIEGEEYLAWGADDSYIVELVKSKLVSVL